MSAIGNSILFGVEAYSMVAFGKAICVEAPWRFPSESQGSDACCRGR